ncbi:hypothetical protein K435DRAFT_859676 [Dendrothele bispora CBS 962.96]|uniref:RING-type domain-containing protein n=1 Tax=Dendrothele bispora (strain CBS 962.96) TaxID=1314807 RepID=A0A4S8M0H3_DENBC|nr:hypothetical protein K435DRAFT_859676 [Dendrothele bispora CBS 962.96]
MYSPLHADISMDFDIQTPTRTRIVKYSSKSKLARMNNSRRALSPSSIRRSASPLPQTQDSNSQAQTSSTQNLEPASVESSLTSALARIKELENSLRSIRSQQIELHNCPICYDLAWHPYILPCGHIVCGTCLKEQANHHLKTNHTWRTMKCGLCQQRIDRPPILCYPFRHAVHALAGDQGFDIPPHQPLQWPPRRRPGRKLSPRPV